MKDSVKVKSNEELCEDDSRLDKIEHELWHLVEDVRKLTEAIEELRRFFEARTSGMMLR